MNTKYGELNVGDVYTAADGSSGEVIVIDVDTYAEVEDAVVENREGRQYRIDWFKLMMVRYCKKEA